MCTKIYEQWAQIMPTTTVMTTENKTPPHLNAYGMANTPVPRHAFNRCANVSESLRTKQQQNKYQYNIICSYLLQVTSCAELHNISGLFIDFICLVRGSFLARTSRKQNNRRVEDGWLALPICRTERPNVGFDVLNKQWETDWRRSYGLKDQRNIKEWKNNPLMQPPVFYFSKYRR